MGQRRQSTKVSNVLVRDKFGQSTVPTSIVFLSAWRSSVAFGKGVASFKGIVFMFTRSKVWLSTGSDCHVNVI